MEIEGHIAWLTPLDRQALGLPQSRRNEFVARLPIEAALEQVQSELSQNSGVKSEMWLPESAPGFTLRHASLQWRQRRLQKLAGAVLVYETTEYLIGKSHGTAE